MGGKHKRNKANKDVPQNHENDTSLRENTAEQELISKNVEKHSLPSAYSDVTPSKRYIEDDENSEPEIKRKKKKKQTAPVESTGKKNKKSIRQIKREKHAERQAEAEAAAKDQLKSQCISYLAQWKHDRSNWKFMKAKQVWLYKNKFSQQLVPDSSWPLLLEYFESAKGNIRNMLLTDANKIIKQMDDWTESQGKAEKPDDETENSKEIIKPDDIVYNRARSLIQSLEE